MQCAHFFPNMGKSATLTLTRRVVNHLTSGVDRGWHHRRMPDLEGRVAFITGGSGGLGSAIAAALAAQGAAVAVADLPIEQGQLNKHTRLKAIASRHGATPAQVALAWVLRQADVIAIPKAGTPEHVVANRRAVELRLTPDDLAQLDQAFPPPSGPQPLEML
jgi:Aldo/keto reductase family/short chain dehydrogenase